MPELPNPPPPDPNSGNLVLFFRTSKTTFRTYDRKVIDYDNDSWHDNYGRNVDNFDDNDDPPAGKRTVAKKYLEKIY